MAMLRRRLRMPGIVLASLLASGAHLASGTLAHAAPALPEIRMTAENRVPACVTPERLMAFLQSRNAALSPRFKGIAAFYKYHGEAWRVRWDYAFFQMAIETNFLSYRRPDGRMGDVDPRQNNFAGIGTTGGGVPGDSFPDVKTGVLGQIQHLVVYSGEQIAQPVAARTQLKQGDILVVSRGLNRPVRFSDLARRWAADPKYGSSIEWVAQGFRNEYCRGGTEAAQSGAGLPRLPNAKQPLTQQIEVLPWANKPLRPRADHASGLTTGTIAEAQDAPQSDLSPSPSSTASPVRTVWRRTGDPERAPPLADVIAKSVISATEGESEPAQDVATIAADSTATANDGPSPFKFVLFTPPAWLGQHAELQSGEAIAAGAPTSAFDPSVTPPSGLGMKQEKERCRIEVATFGGEKTVLVRAPEAEAMRYIAVSVVDGFEKSMTASFISARAAGGEAVGEFATREAALAKAKDLCQSAE
ncbi:MAG: hypothetical protein WC807_01205 [Hyphomicrobium sp.]